MSSTKSTREAERKKKRIIWRRHLQSWRDSGLSQSEYCRSTKLSIKCFGYWKRKLSDQIDSPTKFVQLPVEQLFKPSAKIGSPQSAGLTLIHNKSIRVEIAEDFSPLALSSLIRLLEGL